MKITIGLACAMVLAIPTLAIDLGTQAPPKLPSIAAPNVPVAPRQGGDTISTAVLIPSIPVVITGTTTGFTNDYDWMCPFDSQCPDVVYVYRPAVNEDISVDLCGSAYDTKTYIFDEAMQVIACNDDYYVDDPCGMYRSKIEHAELLANEDYYLVIDGYGHEHGEYTLAIDFHELCDLACPANGVPEGEPALHDGYVDGWNGGCDTSDSDPPFQAIVGDPAGAAVLCGVAGWYLDPWYYRDTDWYTVAMGPTGALDITIDAEVETHVGELLPHDCAAVAVTSYATAYCEPATLTVSGHAPGEVVWLWVSSARFTPPGWGFEEYEYMLWISGLETGVAVEAVSWSTIKALYE